MIDKHIITEEIRSLIENGHIAINLNENESDLLYKLVYFMTDEEFQPKQSDIIVPTIIAALSILRDIGANVKVEEQSKYKVLFDLFSFDFEIDENQNIMYIGEKNVVSENN